MSLVCTIALMLGTTLAGHCETVEAMPPDDPATWTLPVAPPPPPATPPVFPPVIIQPRPPVIIQEAAPPAPAWPPASIRLPTDEWPGNLPTLPKGWVWTIEAHAVPEEAE